MAEEISIERQQLRILVDAIKKIVTHPRTPNWIKNPLEDAVKSAKELSKASNKNASSITAAISENVSEPAKNENYAMSEPIELDLSVECRDALDPRDTCRYVIVRRSLVVEGVQLWDVRVSVGDSKTPVGVVIHNVPSDHLLGLRRLQDPKSRQSSESASSR
jgi:hypothetical protein